MKYGQLLLPTQIQKIVKFLSVASNWNRLKESLKNDKGEGIKKYREQRQVIKESSFRFYI